MTDSATYRSRPSWSPHSSKIVYSKLDAEGRDFDLFVIDIADNKITNVTETPDMAERFPIWLPDNKIAFISPTGPQKPHKAYVMNMDTSELRDLQLLIDPNTSEWCWSPDGAHILLSRHTMYGSPPTVQEKIYLMDVASGKETLWMEDATQPDWGRLD